MENITFKNNPQENSNVIVYTRGVGTDAKAAKLDNYNKRPVLARTYSAELIKLSKMPSASSLNMNKQESVANNSNFAYVYYDLQSQQYGARKLKVKSGVVDKNVLAKYNKSIEGMKPTIVFSKEELNEAEFTNAIPNEEVKLPPIKDDLNKAFPSLADTRVSRLERTGEIPVAPREVEKPSYNNGVINAPDRFVAKVEDVPVNSLPSRMSRMEEKEPVRENDLRSTEIGRGAKELDRINNLVHGNEGNDLSAELQSAHKRLEEAVKENRRVVNQSATLEEQIQSVRATVEKLRKEKAQAQQRELDKTLNMIEVTKEENLDATRRMTNLQAELAELIRQRDEMLSDSYSQGRAM